MRLLCVVLVLASADLVMAQEDTFRKSLQFVGCYELHVAGAHQTKAKDPDLLPSRFQLVMRASAGKDGFIVRIPGPKVADSSLMATLSFWKANLDGTLHIVWSTGYVAWAVGLSGSGPELRGTAHYFTDTDPSPPTNRDVAVAAQRVGCTEPAK